jgi:hypothetical protein
MDPTTVAAAIKAVAEVKKTLDTAALRRTVEDIQLAIVGIRKQLDEHVLREVRTGFDHLATAVEAASQELRRDELLDARKYFAQLANHSAGGVVVGSSGTLSCDEVCALGHFGNYHYFLLRGEPRQALIAAYRCTERFPALGVQLFPRELFSRDYRSVVIPSETRREQLEDAYGWAQTTYQSERRSFREWAWRVPAAGGAVVAGLIAGAVTPPLAHRGVVVAAQLLGRGGPVVPPSAPSDQELLAHRAELGRLLAPVAAEAHERRRAIEASQAR